MLLLPVKAILQLCVKFLFGGATCTGVRLQGYQQSKCGQQIVISSVKSFFDIATDFPLWLCFELCKCIVPKSLNSYSLKHCGTPKLLVT